MKLFKSKPAEPVVDETTDATAIWDEQYRQELRQVGYQQLKSLIDSNADLLRQEMEGTMQQVAGDLKEYLAKQLDTMISTVNTEITAQLNERIKQYDQLSSEAQDLATQSLTRHSQAVYEKYQQFSTTLQQTVASQEVQMVTVFQDNKARVSAAQAEQDKALAALRDLIESARRQSERLQQEMQQAIATQASQLNESQQANAAAIASARQAQAAAVEQLQTSSQALEQQHQQLSQLLDKSVADQKAMLIRSINDNMARIIEYYLVGALGEQSDLRTQLPSILEQMEQSKQAMVDDMSL